MNARALALVGALASASCGAPLMKLPGGPGQAAPGAAAALTQATAACRTIRTITAEIGVSGSVGRRKLRGRLLAGLSAPASVRLEAPAPFGQPVFIFVARGDDATVLLPRDRAALEHGRPDAVLEAVTGVSLTPSELRTTLTGCAYAEQGGGALSPAFDDARDLGHQWLMIPGATRLYLRRGKPGDPWRIVVAIAHDAGGAAWRAEYSNFVDGLPRAVRLASEDAGRFNLRLALSQVELNVPIEADAFRVQIPAATDPLTLEQLRDAGPLADAAAKSNGR